MSIKYSQRMSLESLELGEEQDPKGKLFFNDTGMSDLTNVNIVGNFVDTVRQLYFGTCDLECLNHLEEICKTRSNITNEVLHGEWHVSHMGKAARYRYKIQNNQIGIVVLFGSYFQKVQIEHQHLKIELSPKFISSNSPQQIQDYMDSIAGYFMSEYKTRGCAVHLACDVQGWLPPDDFIEKFTTYSRTIKTYDGISSLDLSDINMSAATYGGKSSIKNYLIGRASALQFCIYDKSVEIKASDKVDFYHEEWKVFSLGTYMPLEPVKRIEARIHHTIVREIGNGLNEELESFLQVSDYLSDIWRYALSRNRLDVSQTTISPFWQLIQEDCQFYCPADGLHIIRKKKEDVSAIGRNFTAILGNMISVMARDIQTKPDDVLRQLKFMTFYQDMLRYYNLRGIGVPELRDLIEKGLSTRRLLGKAA